MSHSVQPSNTALQRTRSAPLRSPLSFKTLGMLRQGLALALCAALILGASAQRTETMAFDIVDEGAVNFTVRLPARFDFERFDLAFAVKTGTVMSRASLHVFVIPSELPLEHLPGHHKRVRGFVAGIPVRWRVYNFDQPLPGTVYYSANLYTGIDDCGGNMQVGVTIDGNDRDSIDSLLEVAAGMSIETRRKLGDADAVEAKCHRTTRPPRP